MTKFLSFLFLVFFFEHVLFDQNQIAETLNDRSHLVMRTSVILSSFSFNDFKWSDWEREKKKKSWPALFFSFLSALRRVYTTQLIEKKTIKMNDFCRCNFSFEANFVMFLISHGCRMCQEPDKSEIIVAMSKKMFLLLFSSLFRFFFHRCRSAVFLLSSISPQGIPTNATSKGKRLSRLNKRRSLPLDVRRNGHLFLLLFIVFLDDTKIINIVLNNSRSSNSMGKGNKNFNDHENEPSTNRSEKRQITWQEIRQHSTKKDRWLVIDDRVYDVTHWIKHPGGQAVLNHYAGQDASVKIFIEKEILLHRCFSFRRLFTPFTRRKVLLKNI